MNQNTDTSESKSSRNAAILHEGVREIERLRRANEVLEARWEVMQIFAAACGLRQDPKPNGCHDIVHGLEEVRDCLHKEAVAEEQSPKKEEKQFSKYLRQGAPVFKYHKQVSAFKIGKITEAGPIPNQPLSTKEDKFRNGAILISEDEENGAVVFVNREWLEKHQPLPNGYFVECEDGKTEFISSEIYQKRHDRDSI